MRKLSIKLTVLCCAFPLFLLGCWGANQSGNPFQDSKEEAFREEPPLAHTGSSSYLSEEALERMKELQLMKPTSMEEFKAWLPNSIGVFKRSSFSAGNQWVADISTLNGEYINPVENKKMNITIIDGAGKSGGGFTVLYIGQFSTDFEEQHAYGYSKSVYKHGKQGVLTVNTLQKKVEFEFLEGKRYYVKLNGINLAPDELFRLMDGFKLHKLPR